MHVSIKLFCRKLFIHIEIYIIQLHTHEIKSGIYIITMTKQTNRSGKQRQ